MLIIPAIVFVIGVGLAVLFEMVWAYVDRRWITPMDKDAWCLAFWVSLSIVGVFTRVIPFESVRVFEWVPFFLVFVVHLFMCVSGPSFARRAGPSASSPKKRPSAPSDPRTVVSHVPESQSVTRPRKDSPRTKPPDQV